MKVLIILTALCTVAYGDACLDTSQLTVIIAGANVSKAFIYNDNSAMTAASILYGHPITSMCLRDNMGNIYGVESMYTHPMFDPTTGDNDICMMKPNSSFIMGLNVQPMKIATTSAQPGDTVSMKCFMWAQEATLIGAVLPKDVGLPITVCPGLNPSSSCISIETTIPCTEECLGPLFNNDGELVGIDFIRCILGLLVVYIPDPQALDLLDFFTSML